LKGISRPIVYGLVAVGVIGALMTVLVAWDSGALGSVVDPAFAGLGRLFLPVAVLGALGVVGFIFFKKSMKMVPQRRATVIGVNSDVLTVDERPGMAYPLRGATIGTWGAGGVTAGTALHLQSGTHRFVLGGRDYRSAYGARLDASHVSDVDASVSDSDFSEILEIAGLRDREDALPPAPGSPIRCLLYPNPFLFQNEGFVGQYKIQQYTAASNHPLLAIDVGTEAIWLTDPQNNALIASSWRTQATAIPTTYQPGWTSVYGGTPFLNSAWGGHNRNISVAPQMVVSVPSLPPLTIACLEARSSFNQFGLDQMKAVAGFGSVRRFEWRGAAQVVDEPAEYSVSAADWLTLVEAFRLNEYLADHV
jgi:hypothetical protein